MTVASDELRQVSRLQRVFELELARGCDNQAVIGGLDRMFVQMMEDGLLAGGPLRRQVSALPPGGYRTLDEATRNRWLAETIEYLRGPAPTAAAATPRNPRLVRPAAPRQLSAPADGRPVAPSAPRRTAPAPAPSTNLALDSPTTKLPGIGKAAATKLEKLGVNTAGDAVFFFPRRFNDFSDSRKIRDLEPMQTPQTVVGQIFSVREMRFGRRVRGAEAVITDGSGMLRATWWNMPYIAKALTVGETFVVSGRIRNYRGRLQMENPEFEPVDGDMLNTGRLVPVYPATQGLNQRVLRRAVHTAVSELSNLVADPIPSSLRAEMTIAPLAETIRTYHYPANYGEAEKARQRLALGEFLAVQTAVLMRRAQWQQHTDAPVLSMDDALPALAGSLPYKLTGAQVRCLDEIAADIRGPRPMLRLLQGDVGSGKTVVAFAAMLAAVKAGQQAVLMAPTEILAEQHYRNLAAILGGEVVSALDGVFVPPWFRRPIRVLFLTGSLTAAQKAQVRADAQHGGADIIIGTHALLEAGVQIPRLALAVVDEQHRFGVVQRLKLRQKGVNPHLLVMTATPIPRTLALTVYGDLEVSTIDELPPGRIPIRTDWIEPHERENAYQFLRERLDAGEQAFVICPLVEDSDTLDLRSAEEEFERLRTGPLRRFNLELLHGRMPARQKDEVMARFAAKEAHVLVSTSVIEVGIDIPNATAIVIEGAERFGLSQLHQFRGRVGRAKLQSYCLLFSSEEDPGPDARERLEAMCETNDGFRLAEKDLGMRGEGETWGRIQSGANSMLRVAKLTDRGILQQARGMAEVVLAADPLLQKPIHRPLAAMVKPFLEKATEAN